MDTYYWAPAVSASDRVPMPSGSGGCRHRHRSVRTALECKYRAERHLEPGEWFAGQVWRHDDTPVSAEDVSAADIKIMTAAMKR